MSAGGKQPAFDAETPAQVAVEDIVDGVYFGLPDTVYHAVPRLSGSYLQLLCVSPATFWAKSWLNPEREELDEDETKAQQLGKAYHCARLEPERFHSAYCRAPDKAEYGDQLLTSDAAIKAELKALNEQQTMGTETIVERAKRLVAAGCEKPIWALVMDEHEQQRAGRIAIPAKYFDQIEQDMERIAGNSEIAALLNGGQAEVSIFWTDEHGLKMKARLDYLTPTHWSDLKTFDNSRGKVLAQALSDFVRFNRTYVQAAVHREAVEAVRTAGLDVQGAATDEQRALVAQLRTKPEPLDCWFVFQEKNGIPNLLARQFVFFDVPEAVTNSWDTGADEEAIAAGHAATMRRTGLYSRAQWEVRHAKETFVLYAESYQPGRPWFPLESVGRFSDLDFNTHWIEGKI
jgi:hypothetical protein